MTRHGRDVEQARRMREGHRPAFEAAVRDYYRSVFGQMWHLTGGDVEAAADLTQEAFAEAWRSLDSFQGRSSLRTWLHTVTVRVWHRSRRGAAPSPVADALEAALALASDPAAGPAERAQQAAARDALDSAVATLPGPYREAVTLFYFEHLRYEEIAVELDIPMGTVKSRLHGAIRRLRALVNPSLKEML